MRIWEILEDIGPNILYHATSVDNLYEILEDNQIKPKTGHPITHTGGPIRSKHWKFRREDISSNGYLNGVSLTRNIIFARAWKSDGVVLVLNGDLIKQNFRIIPVSFFGGKREVANESEEFVIGSIKPLSKYLIRIEVSQKTIEQYPLLSFIPKLFSFNPKIFVNGFEWKKTGLDKGTIIK